MNCLLIMPTFHGYYKEISKALEQKGYRVFYTPDERKAGFFDRIIKKVSPGIWEKKFDAFVEGLPARFPEKMDKVIMIFCGRYIRKKHVEFLKERYPEAEFVYYAWDAVKNYPHIAEFYRSFDRSYSFDRADCAEYGMEHLPLFYSNSLKEASVQYDCTFLMSYVGKKKNSYRLVCNALPSGLRVMRYLFLTDRFSYLYNKLFHPRDLRGFKMKDFYYRSLKRDEANDLFASSFAVADCPAAGQSGLTIRTFEVLRLKRKLITTNSNVKTYDFYTPDNIFVVEPGSAEVPESFFKTPFNEKFSLSEDYSLVSFVGRLLGE